MMKKKLKTIGHALCLTAGIAAVGLFYACSEEVQNLLTGNGTEVQVNVSFADADETMTRAADGLNSTSGFSLLTSTNSNSKVRVMVDQNDGSYTPFDYNITAATTLGIATAPTFNSGVSSVNVYGWYPNESLTDFSVAADQTGNGGYCLSDLMAALGTTCTRNIETGAITSAANLSFTHLMAKVKVSLTLASGVTVKSVKFKSMLPQVDVTPTKTSNAVTAYNVSTDEGDVTDITLLTGGSLTSASAAADKLLCGVFPEQQKNGAFLEITASYNAGADQTITYSFSSAKTFEKGNVYVMNISLDGTNVTTGTVDITDWNTAAGTVNIGSGGGDAPTLSPSSLTLTFGDAASSITASAVGTAWSALSENTSVATVSGTGPISVTPVAVGSTTVHVWPTAGVSGGFSTASCPVTVNALTLQTSNSSNGYVTFGSIPTQQWTGSAVEPAAPTITVKVNGGTNTLSASDYNISYSNNTDEGSSAVMTITGKGNYTGSVSTNFTITKDPGISLTSATVGMVIGANGKAYSTIAQANTYSLAAAIIAYKGDGEDNSSYNTGLAISLADVSGTKKWKSSDDGTCTAQNSTIATILSDLQGLTHTATLCNSGHTSHDHQAAAAADGYTSTMATPTGCSKWFLPTIGQWNLIVKAMCGGSTDLTTSTNNSYNAAEFNKKIRVAYGVSESTTCAGDVQADSYWSSVEYSTGNAWGVGFGNGSANGYNKSTTRYVRPVLAF